MCESQSTVSTNTVASNAIVGFGCIFAALFVSRYSSMHSPDAAEYRQIYETIKNAGWQFDFFSRREVLYFFWNGLAGWFGLTFEGYLFVSTVIFCSAKLFAFNRLGRGVGLIPIFLIYVSLYFLLHDAIQYKISFALTFAIWACVFLSENRTSFAALNTVLALGFHPSAILLPFAYLFSKIIQKNRLLIFLTVCVWMLLCLVERNLAEALVAIVGRFEPRYLDYLDGWTLSRQNRSGLFFPYVILSAAFVAYVTVNLSKRFESESVRSQLGVLIIAVGILVLFRNYVSMANRLSDVLSILMIPVLAELLLRNSSGKWHQKITVVSFCVVIFSARILWQWNGVVWAKQVMPF